MHSQGVCCGTSYFAPHVLRPSIAFTMDFNVGDKVFCTCSNGVRVPATVVGLSPEGFIHLEYPLPPCRSPPLVVPQGGGGASLCQPKIFRCGSLCCCVGDCVVGHYHLHPLHSWQDILLTSGEMELDSTTMFPPGTSVMFIRSTGEPVLAQVVGHSEHGDAYRRITYDRDGKTVLHDRVFVRRLSLPRAPSPPRPAQSEASSSTRVEQRALVHHRPKRSL